MSTPLSPHTASLRYSENPSSASLKWRTECYALEQISKIKFYWQTHLLMNGRRSPNTWCRATTRKFRRGRHNSQTCGGIVLCAKRN
jgi:hypothetical protein